MHDIDAKWQVAETGRTKQSGNGRCYPDRCNPQADGLSDIAAGTAIERTSDAIPRGARGERQLISLRQAASVMPTMKKFICPGSWRASAVIISLSVWPRWRKAALQASAAT